MVHEKPKNAHKNAQVSSKNFKLGIHNVVITKNMALCVPTGCVRFPMYCGKMYSLHPMEYLKAKIGGRL